MSLPFKQSPLAIAVAAALATAGATAQTLDNEFQVNATSPTGLAQPSADSAADAAGNFVVVWEGFNDPLQQAGDEPGIEAGLFDTAGNLQSAGLFAVNSTTGGLQAEPGVAMNAGGDFVVVWEDADDGYGTGVFAQRFTAAGAPNGAEFNVAETSDALESEPQVAVADDGRFMVAWSEQGTNIIQMRLFDAMGSDLTGEVQVSNVPILNGSPAIAVGSGPTPQFVIAWEGQDSATDIDGGIFFQRFNADGMPEGLNVLANTSIAGSQIAPAVDVDSTSFVIAWEGSDGGEGPPNDIFAQRFDAGGTPQGLEFNVNSVSAGDQTHPSVAMAPSGEFVISWNSDDQNGRGLFYSVYDAQGNVMPGEAEVQLNATTALNQEDAEVAMDASGNFVAAWRGETGTSTEIFSRRASRSSQAPPSGNPVTLVLEAAAEGKAALSPLALLIGALAGMLAWLRRLNARR